jgi:hypothetical protein
MLLRMGDAVEYEKLHQISTRRVKA